MPDHHLSLKDKLIFNFDLFDQAKQFHRSLDFLIFREKQVICSGQGKVEIKVQLSIHKHACSQVFVGLELTKCMQSKDSSDCARLQAQM